MADEYSEDSVVKMKKRSRLDLATLAGLAVAAAGIVGGLLLEGGKLKDVGQLTAAMIVIGGTLGAVMISTPLQVLLGAVRRFVGVFMDQTGAPRRADGKNDRLRHEGRKLGLVALEREGVEDHRAGFSIRR